LPSPYRAARKERSVSEHPRSGERNYRKIRQFVSRSGRSNLIAGISGITLPSLKGIGTA